MSENSEKVIESIKNYDYQAFFELLLSEETDWNFDKIDAELLNNRQFDFLMKIKYIEIFERSALSTRLFKDLKSNFMEYDYYAIVYMVINNMIDSKEKGYYLLEAFAIVDDMHMTHFYELLTNNDLYKEFKIELLKTNNVNLKNRAAVYLDTNLILELYENKICLIESIKNSNLSSKEKIEYLLTLSTRRVLNEEERDHLKNVIIEIANSYNGELRKKLQELGAELVEYSDDKLAGEAEKLISIIDKYATFQTGSFSKK